MLRVYVKDIYYSIPMSNIWRQSKCLFSSFERQTENVHTQKPKHRGGAETERERERIPRRLHVNSAEANTGLDLTTTRS